MTPPWTDVDYERLKDAIELSRRCPRADGAYAVGALIFDQAGNEITTGYSRESDLHVHAEEAALLKVVGESSLKEATLYSTLEPCSQRKSRPRSCTELILQSGIPRVVIAWREPQLFVADCQGVEMLTAAGVTVVEIPELATAARRVNEHLPGIGL
ncbi:dCMP deaminase [Streptomyces sp. ISL-96]|uniref:deaminase n=1 Tax=Streptomyces sp. ISL-96 TaxID=2819191 RepID=UPI001BE83013|nr:deaminase [Streptomyces sp. ISL-96]MBT2492077.1 dCMP deaminase [Streptomyces sp. ISL-96]